MHKQTYMYFVCTLRKYSYIHAYIHTYIYIYTYRKRWRKRETDAYVHTYIHAHTHTYSYHCMRIYIALLNLCLKIFPTMCLYITYV